MAQWMRQYRGRTHRTKVRDREDALRAAIERSGQTGASPAAPRLLALAERVVQARTKELGARLAALREPTTSGSLPPRSGRLEEQLRALAAGGALAVLLEFHCPRAVIDDATAGMK